MRHQIFLLSLLIGLVFFLQGASDLAALNAKGQGALEPTKDGLVRPPQVKLDDLFKRLKKADSEAHARVIEADIWEHWSRSGVSILDSLMGQAKLLASRGHLEPSLGLLDRVVHEKPDFVDGWNRRATVLFLMRRDKESLVDIARVLALEPRHFGALAGKALIMVRAGKWQEALDALRRAVEIYPYLRERRLIPELEKKLHVRKI